MEWKRGLILRIKNYKFEDDTSKDKYSIVLYVDDKKVYLIHSLTTSQNNPGVPNLKYGCSVYKNIPYYFIPQGQVICNQEYYFEKDTFIFFSEQCQKGISFKI